MAGIRIRSGRAASRSATSTGRRTGALVRPLHGQRLAWKRPAGGRVLVPGSSGKRERGGEQRAGAAQQSERRRRPKPAAPVHSLVVREPRGHDSRPRRRSARPPAANTSTSAPEPSSSADDRAVVGGSAGAGLDPAYGNRAGVRSGAHGHRAGRRVTRSGSRSRLREPVSPWGGVSLSGGGAGVVLRCLVVARFVESTRVGRLGLIGGLGRVRRVRRLRSLRRGSAGSAGSSASGASGASGAAPPDPPDRPGPPGRPRGAASAPARHPAGTRSARVRARRRRSRSRPHPASEFALPCFLLRGGSVHGLHARSRFSARKTAALSGDKDSPRRSEGAIGDRAGA